MEREQARELIKKYFKEKYYKNIIVITNRTSKLNFRLKRKKTKKK